MDNKGFTSGIARKDGWSAGREMISGNKSQTVSLQADFLQKPGIYTAQFTITPLDTEPKIPPAPPLAKFATLRATATIYWAVEGNTVTRKISVSNGASISGPGQAVRIVIEDITELSPPANLVLGQRYFSAVTLVPGLRAADGVPPILCDMKGAEEILPTGGFSLPVPQNVGVKSVSVTIMSQAALPIPEQAVRVFQNDAGGAPLASYDPRNYFFYPLIPGCTEIFVQNFGPDNILTYITWGIDG